ncbi:hypothetical protein [Anaeromyxobacter oryzisoli]|uniref:hypothetical protein n=1 Tax=Anaeromyxobacter oryzisoli TaxID=2925408 RepID=UPI001F578AB7|nr:hypothetical protein [Anaeromyxobacter sp. SG63]
MGWRDDPVVEQPARPAATPRWASDPEVGALQPPELLPSHAVPGVGETAIRHAANGAALGGAPHLRGLYAAGADAPPGENGPMDPLTTAADVARGIWRRFRGDKSAEARYQAAKKEENEALQRSMAAHPVVGFGAEIAGGAPLGGLAASVAPTIRGGGLLPRAANAALQGGAVGTVSGLVSGEDAGEIGSRAGVGALTGSALPLAGAAWGAAKGALGRTLIPRLRDIAVAQGRKVLTGNTAPLATRKPLSPEAVRVAYEEGAIGPFGTVEKAAEKLGASREAVGDQYGQIIDALAAKGVTGPKAQDLAAQLVAEATATEGRTLGSPTPGLFRSTADELTSKPTDAAGYLGLAQAENMKRTLQQAARSEYVKEGPQSLAGEAKTGIASRLRQAIEDAVSSQASKAPEEAAAFEPVKERLSRIIEASNAANRGAARAANRQTHGLGAKVMASGALAHGGAPEAAVTLAASTAARNRLPATLGWLANTTADALAPGAATPHPMSPQIAALIASLRKPGLRLAPSAMTPAAADEEGDR